MLKMKINKINQIVILSLSIILILLVFTQSSFSQKNISDLDQLTATLRLSKYSGFQQNMILDTTQQLLSLGVNDQELEKVLIASIANHFDAYNIKKILEILVDAKKNGLSEVPLMNKIKEGLAKKIEERIIIAALLTETGNMKVASEMLREHKIKVKGSYSEQVMIEGLADGLNNGVPQETLSEVLSRSIEQGKEVEEIAEVSEELSNLSLRAYELGFSEEEVLNVFQKALQTRTEIEEICEDIQDILIGAAAAKMTMVTSNNSSGLPGQIGLPINDGTSESTSIGAPDTGLSSSSSGSGISSAPTDSDDQPDVETKPDDGDDNSSPPEN